MVPGLAGDGLAGLGLCKERWVQLLEVLALRQEQPLCSLLQSADTHTHTQTDGQLQNIMPLAHLIKNGHSHSPAC